MNKNQLRKEGKLLIKIVENDNELKPGSVQTWRKKGNADADLY